MTGDFQTIAKHGIIQDLSVTAPRISITFQPIPLPMQVDRQIDTQGTFCTLHSLTIKYIKHVAEEIFCRKIGHDFVPSRGFGPNEFLFINTEWGLYGDVVPKCLAFKCLAIIVASEEIKAGWMDTLLLHTTHSLEIDQSEINISKGSPSVKEYIANFREPRGRGRSILNLRVPKIVDCEAAIAKFPQRKKLPLFEGKFDASFPPQPIDINYIIHLATTLKLDLPDELVKSFVSDLKVNEGKFSTHYTGDSEWAPDHSEDCIEHEEQI